MALRDEIIPYVDGNGLVAPGLTSGVGRGSDNGPMFSSEYFVMLKKLGQLTDQDKKDFDRLIGACVTSDGLLNRAPVGTDSDQEGPDDYYGVLNGCKQLGNTSIPRKMLWAVVKYLGFLNNNQPGKWTKESFLVRQVQMLAAMVAAAFPSWKNPIHILIRLACSPLFFIAGLVLCVSCWGADPHDSDARRLAWHLMQATKGSSLWCWIGSKIWLKRLYKTYGQEGMRAVAYLYYQDKHPFRRYWVTE